MVDTPRQGQTSLEEWQLGIEGASRLRVIVQKFLL